jgi:glycosyltransferase involved in cell wall biosynthesis
MDTIKPVVLIPVYNNGKTIKSVIIKSLSYINTIIVINDGSTDETTSILKEIASTYNKKIHLIELKKNFGKGFALKAGFKKAYSLGFTHAITLDGDGQHFPEDILNFLEKIKKNPYKLYIGERIIDSGTRINEPFRSKAGRKFGSFWYKFITGIEIRDTQCGYRAYPLLEIKNIRCNGKRYDFEQEMLVKAAWNGINIESIPVHHCYLSANQKVSHFKPVRDFLQIFKVNSVFVLIKIFLPFLILNTKGEKWSQKLFEFFKKELRRNTSPKQAASSISLGVFIGILPIYFFQVATLFILSIFLKINRPLAFLGVCVSSPPFLPIIISIAIAIGQCIVPVSWTNLFDNLNHSFIIKGGIYWFFGSIVLAFICYLICWILSYLFFLYLENIIKKN